LPEATTVAHKTGTGGRDDENVLSALNDAGILILPDGSAVAITVFITKSPDEEKELEAVIAKIARSVYTYYSTGK
jgi:beta-lactamase class A